MGNSYTKKLSMLEYSNTEKAKIDLRQCEYFNDISSFQNNFQGNVILPFDGHRYRDARYRAFNFDQRGYPLIIVQPKNASQVAEALEFHRTCPSASMMTLAVISGGHSSKGMINGAFVIDLLFMNQVVVHKESMTVSVGGGTYIKEIDRALAPYNLAIPTGTYPVVGIGGLALGGGYGWLTRRYGLTVDYVVQLEVVLADGRIVVASDTNDYKDLLWACRGGGGNFGIVTSFLLRCVKLPSKCYGGFVFYFTPTIDSAAALLRRYDSLVQTMGFDVTGSVRISGGSMIIPTVWVHCGEEANVDEVISFQAAKKLGGWVNIPFEVSLKERSYHNDVQSMLVPFQTNGFTYATIFPIGTSDKLLPTEFFDKMLQFTRNSLPVSIERASVAMNTMGGAATHADDRNIRTCIPDLARRARYFMIIEVIWKAEYEGQGKIEARQWAQQLLEILSPYKTVGMKYAADELQHDTNEADFGFSRDVYLRLKEIKSKYDGSNLFCNNLNIVPLYSGTASPQRSMKELTSFESTAE